MDNINVITILNALAEQLQRANGHIEELTAQNEEYKHDNKELYGFICNLEKELADKDAIIARLEGELKKGAGALQIPCVNCMAFEKVACNPAFRSRCKRWDIRFTELDGAINPYHFSCPYAEAVK